MIPTAVRGYMPFIPPNSGQRRIDCPTKVKSVNSGPRISDLRKLSPPNQNVVLTASPRKSLHCETSSDKPSFLLKLSSVNRNDLLSKDTSWRALLRTIFKSKGKKGKKVDLNDNHLIIEGLLRRRMSAPAVPIHRSRSVSMPQKNMVKLESIVEEDHDLISTTSLSAPDVYNRVRPSSDQMDRKMGNLILQRPDEVWSDSDSSSSESLHVVFDDLPDEQPDESP